MNPWIREVATLSLLLLAAIVVGVLGKILVPMLFVLLVSILIRQFYQIYRFEKWIDNGGSGKYPKSTGIWEAIYYHVYRMKKREKKRKKKLGKMVDQFRKSTEALPDAAVVLGPSDEIEWTNKAAMKVLGLDKSDKGQRIPNLIRFPEFTRYLDNRKYDDVIVLPSPVDANVMLSVRVVPYGVGLRLLLAQDVTQLKKMEIMRKDFVANVSHELRTPLTVLKGYLETIKDMDDGESGLLSNSITQMQSQTERMEHLVDDLLLLTRLETQKKKAQCVDIPGLLSKICSEGASLKKSSGRIDLKLDSQAKIIGVEEDLRSAFTNLLVNALKYSSEDSIVNVRWYEHQGCPRLDVEDHGEGIAASEIPRVTERFYRVDTNLSKKQSGTGLGLAIVKHALQNHEAKLEINSEVGKGSCFSCIFPGRLVCRDEKDVVA
ncbi:MAG: phosphate regulon sensor histidine kinase PhoR [Gammaproteobacteria bacterium]|uniref:phosphate regulon sensor histidine kinase PhoR n=1 Tax=Methylotuvimicrobium sp. TaxID=2822413 RepID=UPI001DC3A193|nr:phosphate regulon sensor histidine kinase PhoR [Gammaproteobacteria bacterium]